MWEVAHISRWVRHCSACRDTHCVVSQSLIVTVLTDICRLSLDNHFLDLCVNGNLLLNIGLKELTCHIIVSTKLKWAVFGCCGVFCKRLLKFGCTKIVINWCRSSCTVHYISQNYSYNYKNFCIRRCWVVNSYLIVLEFISFEPSFNHLENTIIFLHPDLLKRTRLFQLQLRNWFWN